MDFFETPSWDGNHGADKLTDELFHSPNVSSVKVSKRRKRNKYPKGSIADEHSKNSGSPNKGKGETAKVKKKVTCGKDEVPHFQGHILISKRQNKCKEVLKQTTGGRIQSNYIYTEKMKCSSSQSNSVGDDINSISFSNAKVNSTLLPKPPIKHKKKYKHIVSESENKNGKSVHNLKALKDKLDLNVKVKSCDKITKAGVIIRADDHKQEEPANNFIKNKMHGSSCHAIKNLKNATINLNCEQGCDKLLSHLEKKKRKNETKKKIKIKTTETTNLSHSIINIKGKQSPTPKSVFNESNSPLSEKRILSDDGDTKKFKKKRKEDNRESCENAGELINVASSHSLGVLSATMCKKRKHPENSETTQRVKRLRKDFDTQVHVDSLASEKPLSNMKVVLHQARELDSLGEIKNPVRFQNNGAATSPKKKLTLREKMMEKLRGSRFRFLNEQMYSAKSEETRKIFQKDQESFAAYHEGYKQQLLQWPVKPIDIIIKYLKKKPANYIIADFGCGDAQIAQSLPNQVHSFDHIALNDHVTACDMAHTHLPNGSVDVAVFCLSLMGSNLSDYIYEANRVLKIGGILKIAEVESRFDDVEKFIKVICKFGFLCIRKDLSGDVFYLFDFKKEKTVKDGKSLPTIKLRACFYKKR